jgi:hypothetical protein
LGGAYEYGLGPFAKVSPAVTEELLYNSTSPEGYPNGSLCYVTVYENATDPSYNELMGFLVLDNTEHAAYVPGVYECSNFAIHLYDDAEAQGAKAHIVGVQFTDGEWHMLDAFNTTDRGTIYIDDTGYTAQQKAQGYVEVPCMVNLSVGGEYIKTPIPPVMAMFQDAPDFFSTTTSIGTISSYKVIN